MTRIVTVGGRPARARSQRADTREEVVERLIALLAPGRAPTAAELVVFPELALTTFFPRWCWTTGDELDAFYETEMPGPETKPLFDEAARLGVGFSPRLRRAAPPTATATTRTVLVERDGRGRRPATARSTCPATRSHEPWRPFQHLERHYFEPGPDGFGVWRGLRRHGRA